MRVFAKRTLREFWENPRSADSEGPLRAWHAEAEKASWQSFADVRESFATASAVGSDRVVFNIGGNKYRIVARINYQFAGVLIRFIGTHEQYDEIDTSSI